MNFSRDFSLNTLCTGLVFVLGLANQWLLANHLLDKAEYGRLGLWTNAAMIGAMVCGEWVRRGSTYVVGKEGAGAEARDNAVIYCLLLLAVAMGLAYVGAGFAGRLLGSEAVVYWPLLAVLPGLFVLQRLGMSILLGADRIQVYVMIPVLFIAVYLAGNIGLWLLGAEDLAAVLSLFAGAAGVAGLVAFAALWNTGRFTGGDGQVMHRTFSVGARGAVSVVLVFLLLKVDVFLIDYFLGNAAAGSYRIATVFADMMQRLPDVAGAVLLAKVVRGEDKSLLSLRVAQGILVFSLVAALILLVGGQMLIGLFFPAFPEAYEPLVWMLPGLLFLGFGSVCNTKLAGQGYPAITLWAAALALVVNILLNFIFIPMLGLKGAALATSMAYAIWSLVIGSGFLRSEGLAWGDLLRVWELASARGQKSP